MITLQHSLVTLLGLNSKGKSEEEVIENFREQIPYVLLPDGIRKYVGPRAYSHFEESSDTTEISYMKFPLDLKHFSKDDFENIDKFLSSKITPAAIGEKTHIEKFEETNAHLPETYYIGVKKHLTQDYIFDDFIRNIVDCSKKYEGRFIFNGEEFDGNTVRKLIADIENEGLEILAYMAQKEMGITVNQEWFDKNVKDQLCDVYPQELVDSTYGYMKIPEGLNKRITERDFSELERKIENNETIIPYSQYKEMYKSVIYQMKDIDREHPTKIPELKINKENFSYEKLRKSLIARGADSKLFDMPAIRERLESESVSPDDIVVNSDGTFNFGRCIIGKTKIEREVEVSANHELVDPYGFDDWTSGYTTYETKKVECDVLTIVEHLEVDKQKNQALDAPLHLDQNYESTYKEKVAKLTVVDDNGIEKETQLIDNSYFIQEEIQRGKLSYRSFEENSNLISQRNVRKDGMIFSIEANGRENKFYDNGKWNLSLNGMASIGTQEGDKPSSAMYIFDANSQRLVSKYPHLQASTEKRKQALMTQIDTRTLSLVSENLTLENKNEKLQKMLQKALTFAQTVRDSRVGKIFFGKKAKEVLGDQDKDTKQLTEGR